MGARPTSPEETAGRMYPSSCREPSMVQAPGAASLVQLLGAGLGGRPALVLPPGLPGAGGGAQLASSAWGGRGMEVLGEEGPSARELGAAGLGGRSAAMVAFWLAAGAAQAWVCAAPLGMVRGRMTDAKAITTATDMRMSRASTAASAAHTSSHFLKYCKA